MCERVSSHPPRPPVEVECATMYIRKQPACSLEGVIMAIRVWWLRSRQRVVSCGDLRSRWCLRRILGNAGGQHVQACAGCRRVSLAFGGDLQRQQVRKAVEVLCRGWCMRRSVHHARVSEANNTPHQATTVNSPWATEGEWSATAHSIPRANNMNLQRTILLVQCLQLQQLRQPQQLQRPRQRPAQ